MKRKYELRAKHLTKGDHSDFKALKDELGFRNNSDAIRYLLHDRKGVRGIFQEMKEEWNVSSYAMDKLLVPQFSEKAKGMVASVLAAGNAFLFSWSKKKRSAYKQFLTSDMKPEEIEGAMIRLDEILGSEE